MDSVRIKLAYDLHYVRHLGFWFDVTIYLGTVGIRGAYRAMRDGYVDDDWAHEHHAYWHRAIQEGKIPAKRTREAPPVRPAIQP